MRLNIYLISHPIIKILSNSSKYQTTDTSSNEQIRQKYLGFLLFYEIMRKNFYTRTVYIKQISDSKTVFMPDPQKQNYIITNLLDTYSIVSKITEIIPNLNIINISQPDISQETTGKIQEILKYNRKFEKKIVIFETTLIQNYTTHLIEFLINKLKISIKEIDIACLICSHQVLNKISQKYPQLNIYTTRIML
uniref:Uracil phosphoribosyltransferase n=1 Tax=Caloglossa intermedia TaxID=100879 RepID=A0A1Z1M6C4_9FLOR|nr:uracil phosphoribosyltransferase [Caloglossa intermedia]ARW61556.1 uracil phosphoribosyltransferase [Caloglossa intermedia]